MINITDKSINIMWGYITHNVDSKCWCKIDDNMKQLHIKYFRSNNIINDIRVLVRRNLVANLSINLDFP